MKVEGAATNRIGAVYGGKRPIMAIVMVTEDMKRGIKQLRELEDRFLNGSIDPRDCRSPLQDIIQGKFSSAISFVQQVGRQLARWQEAGVAINPETRECILEQADQFVPSTLTDEPLVSGGYGYVLLSSVNRLWEAITPPAGYQKVRYMNTNTVLRYASYAKTSRDAGLRLIPGLRLIHFDPNGYQGLSPKDALVRAKSVGLRLAGVEVLEKLLVDSNYCTKWNGSDHPFPNLSGLQVKYSSDWSHVPCLRRWDDNRQLSFGTDWADDAGSSWSSPVVREC